MAKEIFDLFSSGGINSYSLLPLRSVPAQSMPPLPSNRELFELYRDTLELWFNKESDISSIEPLSTILGALLGVKPQLCSFAASCPERMIAVDQNGNVTLCCSLVKDEFIMGNVLNESLTVILKKGTTPLLQFRNAAISNYCAECEYLTICQGGCRTDSYWSSGSLAGPYPHCESRKLTFHYLENQLKDFGILAK